MAFFTKSIEAEHIAEKSGGDYINQSGIYDIEILTPFITTNDKDAMTVDFFINYNDQQQVLYGNLRLTNNDGSENFGAQIFNKLLVIADVDTVSDPEDVELPIGKEGAPKDVAALTDLSNIPVKIQIKMEYSIYNGDIKEKKIIKNFFRQKDGATAEEIVNDVEPGKQLKKTSTYAEKAIYKNDLTEEIVNEWILANRPKGTAPRAKQTPKTPSFGKKKFGK